MELKFTKNESKVYNKSRIEMPRKSKKNNNIRDYILSHVESNPSNITALVVQHFGVTRTTANKYLQNLIAEGLLEAEGQTKARVYKLRDFVRETFEFLVDKKAEEHKVWRLLRPYLEGVPRNVIDICGYGVTEMVNNVIDHSQSDKCRVYVCRNAKKIEIIIRDYGVGIWENIRKQCDLDDARHALLELSKGKLTTDPKKHSGEGIFFTSRMFNSFTITSGLLYYMRRREKDVLMDVEDMQNAVKGTVVDMQINVDATHTDREIFRQYEGDDRRFSKTYVSVYLAQYGDEQMVSRSQAKRLLARLEKFSEIVLDFKNIPQIGQAFADEIFRVFAEEHPEVHIYCMNTTQQVDSMIKHVKPTKA